MPSVRCHKLALSHESATVDLKTPLKKSGSLRVGLSHIGDADGQQVFLETVEAKRLDDLLAEEKIDQVDIVKLDVEGAEEQVIAGAPNLFIMSDQSGLLSWFRNVQIILANQQKRFS